MSTISNIHDIIEYTGKNKPLDGQVLLTYTSKEVKKNSDGSPSGIMRDYGISAGTKPQNSCVSVPRILDVDVTARVTDLLPYIQDMLHDARREVLREKVLQATGMSQKGLPANWTVKTEEVSLDAIIARMQAESTSSGGGRFSKEVLGDWFISVAGPVLAAGIMAKRGISPDTPEDSPAMTGVLRILEAVQDSLSDVVFSKKRPSADTLDKIDLIFSRLEAAGITKDSDSTYNTLATKVATWRGAAPVEDWTDAI